MLCFHKTKLVVYYCDMMIFNFHRSKDIFNFTGSKVMKQVCNFYGVSKYVTFFFFFFKLKYYENWNIGISCVFVKKYAFYFSLKFQYALQRTFIHLPIRTLKLSYFLQEDIRDIFNGATRCAKSNVINIRVCFFTHKKTIIDKR